MKKYGNRRLYDTDRSRYVNLEDLAGMIRGGADVKVVDATTGDDLTRDVLLQIVLETLNGADLLPIGFLRRMIRASGDDPVQRLLRQQIASGLDVLAAQMDQVERLFAASPPPPPPSEPKARPEPRREAGADEELDELRSRLAKLEARLGRGA